MKILIASGSFKDVFNSINACKILQDALVDCNFNIEIAPISDGGEYTFDTLLYYFKPKIISVENVLNPYLKPITSHYLAIGDVAWIISSEILHLNLSEDSYKNPLNLTDFGFGQLVNDAIKKGYRKIYLCLGGTSTVSCGIGFAQALGAKFLFKNFAPQNQILLGKDLVNISQFSCKKFEDVEMNVIEDGITPTTGMDIITKSKIGQSFFNKKDEIFNEINCGIKNISDILKISCGNLYTGAAGGMAFGISQLFNPRFFLGGNFFIKEFGIEEKIKSADIVITGEGRFDNPNWGKTPVAITKLAKKYDKKVVFVCGDVDKKEFGVNDYVTKNSKLKSLGVDVLISCKKYYEEFNISNPSVSQMQEITQKVVKDYLTKVLGKDIKIKNT